MTTSISAPTTSATQPAAGLDRAVAVINGKGGTLKTSIVSSLGALIAESGTRVLLVDFDPQGNLSEDLGLGEETDDGEQQLGSVPSGRAIQPVSTGRPRLDIVYGGPHLHDLHAVMQSRQAREPDLWMHALARSLSATDQAREQPYDLILIDCPPGNEALQTLALVAARYAVIPTRSDSSSRKGLREVARRFLTVRPHNPDLELLGVVRTGITTSAKGIREEVREEIDAELGGVAPVFETCIRYAERPAKAVRDTGRLPHELRSRAEEQHKARFERLRAQLQGETRDQGDVVLPPSISNLAGDYAALSTEFVNLLLSAESEVRGRHRR